MTIPLGRQEGDRHEPRLSPGSNSAGALVMSSTPSRTTYLVTPRGSPPEAGVGERELLPSALVDLPSNLPAGFAVVWTLTYVVPPSIAEISASRVAIPLAAWMSTSVNVASASTPRVVNDSGLPRR